MKRDLTIQAVLAALRKTSGQSVVLSETIAQRVGLSPTDLESLSVLGDEGPLTAGRLGELIGLTTGAVTRMIDRLEQAGYVRRVPDPSDRRRVIVELVPEKAAALGQFYSGLQRRAGAEIANYTDQQLELISGFLGRLLDISVEETQKLREAGPASAPSLEGSEHAAPVAGVRSGRLVFRAGANDLIVRGGETGGDLYRARFQGTIPQVRARNGTVTVHYKRKFPFPWPSGTGRAEFLLNPAVPWGLELRGGVSKLSADLRRVDVQGIELVGGASRADLNLGQPAGTIPIQVTGGASEVRVRRPADVPVQVHVVGGVTRLEVDGTRHTGGGELRVAGGDYTRARDRYAIEIVGGLSKMTVERER